MARVAFLGSKAAGLRVLRSMLRTLPAEHTLVGALCAADDADVRSELPAFQAFCSTNSVPLIIARNHRDMEAALREWDPDVAVVLGWYYLLRLEQFSKLKFYAFHYSWLPEYRGNAPVVWQLLQGEPTVGCTLFLLSDGMDEGDYVERARVPVGPEDTVDEVLARLNELAVTILEAKLPSLLDGTVELHPQEHELATYGGLRIPEDGRLDWTLPAATLHNFVRAQTRPYPGAYTTLPDGRVVRIWRARPDPRRWFAVPGSVLERHPGRVLIGCGDGALEVLEAQLDGLPPAPCETIFTSLRQRLR